MTGAPRPSRRAWVLLGGVIATATIAGGWWLARTPSVTAPAPSTSNSPPPSLCATTLSSATLPSVASPPFTAPTSRIVVRAQVSREGLREAIDARLPKTLDAAQRKPVGAAGEITYQVTRGEPTVSIDKGAFVVDLPITASVSICKPLGPLCPTYGRCQPKLNSRTTIPLEPTDDWQLEGASVVVSVQAGCKVAGIDATDEVKKAAETGRRRALAQITGALKEGQAALRQQIQRLGHPIRIDEARCLKLVPEAVRYGSVEEETGAFRLEAAIEGRVQDVACDATPSRVELPPLKRAPLGAPTLRWADVIGYDALLVALRGRLPPEVLAVHAIRPHGAALAVELTMRGPACGRTWTVMTPKLIDGEVQLEGAPPVPALRAAIPTHAMPGLEALKMPAGLSLQANFKTLKPQLQVAAEGLVVVQAKTGSIALKLDPAMLPSR